MSARKLGRLAGLVFVLVAVIGGGVGAAEASAKHQTGVVATADTGTTLAGTLGEIVWD